MLKLTRFCDLNLFFPSDVCTALPEIDNIKTKTVFSVNYGTEVRIVCAKGYTLSGDDAITCVKDRIFNFEKTPQCFLGMWLVSGGLSKRLL